MRDHIQAMSPRNSRRSFVQEIDVGDFLTFPLGIESYGIEILKVQEIRGYETPTAIANAPSFIKGVVNLRGVIVEKLMTGSDMALVDSALNQTLAGS